MLLPRHLSEEGFDEFLADLRDAANAAPRRWRIVYDHHPYVGIHLMVDEQVLAFALLIEAEDWPHKPPRVTPMTPDFRRWLQAHEIPQKPDEHGVKHVVFRGNGRPWFCVNGTREFHDHYKESLPWESIRHLPQNRPHQILEACIEVLELLPPLKVG